MFFGLPAGRGGRGEMPVPGRRRLPLPNALGGGRRGSVASRVPRDAHAAARGTPRAAASGWSPTSPPTSATRKSSRGSCGRHAGRRGQRRTDGAGAPGREPPKDLLRRSRRRRKPSHWRTTCWQAVPVENESMSSMWCPPVATTGSSPSTSEAASSPPRPESTLETYGRVGRRRPGRRATPWRMPVTRPTRPRSSWSFPRRWPRS